MSSKKLGKPWPSSLLFAQLHQWLSDLQTSYQIFWVSTVQRADDGVSQSHSHIGSVYLCVCMYGLHTHTHKGYREERSLGQNKINFFTPR